MQFRRWLVSLGVLPAALGCYQYAPLETSAGFQAGEHIAVEISDRGRAALSDRLGSGVLRLEGTLTRADSADIVMNVWRVAPINGPTAQWSGESVRFNREYASRVQTRTLNRARTYLVAGAVVGGLAWFTTQFDLLGFGREPAEEPEPPGPISSRGWWP
jgi:hypothetical protein